MTIRAALLLSTMLAAGCSDVSAGTGGLPYYADRDLTPRWTATSHHIGAFSLITQTGEPITDRDLAGKLHVASFIYTRCAAICPAIVSNLKKVEAAVTDPRVMLVSYTVTPELDTPPVLAEFGRDRGIDAARWKLVTGDKNTIYRLASDSYFADDERLKAVLKDDDAFLHTEKVVLVDGTGRLRGVYNATQPFDMEKLIADIGALLKTMG
jgi:protein SCO1/2